MVPECPEWQDNPKQALFRATLETPCARYSKQQTMYDINELSPTWKLDSMNSKWRIPTPRGVEFWAGVGAVTPHFSGEWTCDVPGTPGQAFLGRQNFPRRFLENLAFTSAVIFVFRLGTPWRYRRAKMVTQPFSDLRPRSTRIDVPSAS